MKKIEQIHEGKRGRRFIAVHLGPEQNALFAAPARDHVDAPPFHRLAQFLELQQVVAPRNQVLEFGNDDVVLAVGRPEMIQAEFFIVREERRGKRSEVSWTMVVSGWELWPVPVPVRQSTFV